MKRGYWNQSHRWSVKPSETFKGMYQATAYGDGWRSSKNFQDRKNAMKWAMSQQHYIPSWEEVTCNGKYGTD